MQASLAIVDSDAFTVSLENIIQALLCSLVLSLLCQRKTLVRRAFRSETKKEDTFSRARIYHRSKWRIIVHGSVI